MKKGKLSLKMTIKEQIWKGKKFEMTANPIIQDKYILTTTIKDALLKVGRKQWWFWKVIAHWVEIEL